MSFLRRVAMTGTLALTVSAPALLTAETVHRRTAVSSNSDGVIMTGAVLGYVYDPGLSQLRPLIGVPGAASLDSALAAFSTLTLASGRSYGLGQATATDAFGVVNWATGQIVSQPLTDSIQSPDTVAFSPSGTAAVLFSASSHQVQVWTNLPDAPSLSATLDVPVAPVASLAVSDDGAAVLAGLAGEIPSLQLLGSQSRTVASGGSYPAAQFLSGSHDAVYVDGNANQLLLLTDGASAGTTLASDADGIADPAAIGVSNDNIKVIVANRQTPAVTVTDLNAHTTITLSCDRAPSEVSRLAAPGVFRLNSAAKQGLTLLDLSGDTPQLSFIPTPGEDK